MRERVGCGHVRKLLARAPVEGASRAGEPQAPGLAGTLPHQALEDRAVLRIDGKQRRAAAPNGIHDQFAGRHQ